MKRLFYISAAILATLSACKNQDWSFPDYDYSTVYFSYQYPVRTIELGNDKVYDNSFDNDHKCKIMATKGGVYKNTNNVHISINVDNELCEGFKFEGGKEIKAMPSEYYTLASNVITIPSGDISGGVEVQLTDAFFADPLSVENTYVIPVVMTRVEYADSILQGMALVDNPHRLKSEDWKITSRDYTLYAVKYINPWTGKYLRRGVDNITEGGATSRVVRHKKYVEYDEVCSTKTVSMTKLKYPVSTIVGSTTLTCDLILTFSESGECSIASGTTGYTASGSGKFVENGELKSWGDTDRDALYLDYVVDFGTKQIATKDTLVARDRGIKEETFTPVQ